VTLAATQVTVHVHTPTDVWTVVAAVAALFAAAGSLGGLVYARLTVNKAGDTLTELEATRRGIESTRKAMEAGREEEIALRRISQLQRVRELTIDLREWARKATRPGDAPEAIHPEAEGQVRVVAAKLNAVLAALAALHGPPLDGLAQLAWEAEQNTRPLIQVVGVADEHIKHIASLFAEGHPALTLSASASESAA
jgi:hypothetical protein